MYLAFGAVQKETRLITRSPSETGKEKRDSQTKQKTADYKAIIHQQVKQKRWHCSDNRKRRRLLSFLHPRSPIFDERGGTNKIKKRRNREREWAKREPLKHFPH